MPTPALVLAFFTAALGSAVASTVLIRSLERLATRVGLTEAMLGLAAALAADAPEITSATTALLHGQRDVGVGVALGSNVFNLAALLGLGAIVAGQVRLHPRVIILEGTVALWIAAIAMTVVAGGLSAPLGLLLIVAIGIPYLYLSATSPQQRRRIALPARMRHWLAGAFRDEEEEIEPALERTPGRAGDGALAVASLGFVVALNIAMVRLATTLGSRFHVAGIVVGGVVLAAVTSLPNLAAALFLARHSRGAALLSEAMNSNSINVVAGLLVPAILIGIARPSLLGVVIAAWYTGLTLLVLALAFIHRGISRRHGLLVVALYGVFVAFMAVRS